MNKLIIIVLIVSLALLGCTEYSANVFEDFDESDYEKFVTSDLDGALNTLPGASIIKEYNITNSNRLVVKYNTDMDALNIEDSDLFWETAEAYKQLLLLNASVLFSKDYELKEINFYVETSLNIYTLFVKRESIEKYVHNELGSLNTADTMSDLVKSISSAKKVDAFYNINSVFEIKKDDEDC